jgi:hypothetical protein
MLISILLRTSGHTIPISLLFYYDLLYRNVYELRSKTFKKKIHFRTPGHMSGVRIGLRRNVSHPSMCIWVFFLAHNNDLLVLFLTEKDDLLVIWIHFSNKTVKSCMPHVIEATILTGCAKDEDIFISRIPMVPNDMPFEFKRLQFPVYRAFALSINKAQG